MAFAAGTSIESFSGWEAIDDGSTVAITDTSYSVAADITEWTNSGDASFAAFRLECDFATASDANGPVHLYAQIVEVITTSDEPVPSATRSGHYLGTFLADSAATTGAQKLALADCPLPNIHTSTKFAFYLENQAGDQIDIGWKLWINPKGFITA